MTDSQNFSTLEKLITLNKGHFNKNVFIFTLIHLISLGKISISVKNEHDHNIDYTLQRVNTEHLAPDEELVMQKLFAKSKNCQLSSFRKTTEASYYLEQYLQDQIILKGLESKSAVNIRLVLWCISALIILVAGGIFMYLGYISIVALAVSAGTWCLSRIVPTLTSKGRHLRKNTLVELKNISAQSSSDVLTWQQNCAWAWWRGNLSAWSANIDQSKFESTHIQCTYPPKNSITDGAAFVLYIEKFAHTCKKSLAVHSDVDSPSSTVYASGSDVSIGL